MFSFMQATHCYAIPLIPCDDKTWKLSYDVFGYICADINTPLTVIKHVIHFDNLQG